MLDLIIILGDICLKTNEPSTYLDFTHRSQIDQIISKCETTDSVDLKIRLFQVKARQQAAIIEQNLAVDVATDDLLKLLKPVFDVGAISEGHLDQYQRVASKLSLITS